MELIAIALSLVALVLSGLSLIRIRREETERKNSENEIYQRILESRKIIGKTVDEIGKIVEIINRG